MLVVADIFFPVSNQVDVSNSAVAYAAERFILQETFLELKICGLYTRAASNQERLIMASVW